MCLLNVPKKTKHCNYCHRCTGDFDHHCKWLNNCVGGTNYRYFIAMILVFIAQEIIFIAIMSIFIQSETILLQDPDYTRDYFGYVLLAVSIGFTLFLG